MRWGGSLGNSLGYKRKEKGSKEVALGPISYGGIAQFSRRSEPCPKGAGVQQAGPWRGEAPQKEPWESQGQHNTTTTSVPREEGLLPSMPPTGRSPTTPNPALGERRVSFLKKLQK